MICLRSAAKITHKAQSITSQAAKWHVWSTVDPGTAIRDSSDTVCLEDADARALADELVSDYDDDDAYDEIPLPHTHTISFQKRQAFGKLSEFKANKLTKPIYSDFSKDWFENCSDISGEQQNRDNIIRFPAGQNMASHDFWNRTHASSMAFGKNAWAFINNRCFQVSTYLSYPSFDLKIIA